MTLSLLRPAMLAALALLSACGGKATFDINVTLDNVKYEGLVLTETKSGATLRFPTVANPPTSFANTLEYGTEYDVQVVNPKTDNPPHQICAVVSGGRGVAGQTASINVAVSCATKTAAVQGDIKMEGSGNYVGLELINGSNYLTPIVAVAATDTVPTITSYSFPDIPFDVAYNVIIFKQPTNTDVKCVLNRGGIKADAFAGKMGEADLPGSNPEIITPVVIKVECTGPKAP